MRGALVIAAFTLLFGQEQVPFYSDKQNLLTYLDSRLVSQPVKSIADWNIRRSHILKNMEKVMGPLAGSGFARAGRGVWSGRRLSGVPAPADYIRQ